MNLYNLIMLLFLTGCSSYNSKFICKEAQGLPCIMLSLVDKKISQNQIEEPKEKCCK